MAKPGDRELDLMSLLARVLEGARERLAGDGAAPVRARVEAVRGAVERLLPAAGGGEPVDPQRLAADARALRAALAPAAGERGPDELAALRGAAASLAEWLEGGARSGGEVDAIVAELERTLGAIGSPAAAAAQEERDRRLRDSVQASIADRLRRAGIKPSGDP
jgi:hypothetical protein